MERLYDLLAQKGLRNSERVSHLIMDQLSVKQIIDLNASLIERVPTTERDRATLGGFDFIAASDLTAQPGSCPEWGCRLDRVMRVGRFASLYCDTLYIPNYLENYPPVGKAQSFDKNEERLFRYRYAGDIKLILALKPLTQAGIVQFIKTKYHFCKGCAEKIIPHSMIDHVHAMCGQFDKKYLKLCKARLVRTESDLRASTIELHVEGPEDLYEHGGVVHIGSDLPGWLLEKSGLVNVCSRKRVYELTKDDLRRMHIPSGRMEDIGSDVVFQHVLSQLLNTKYLTHRKIDAALVSSLNANPSLSRCNAILDSELACDLPFLENIPLKEILKLRKREYDAFLVFRNTLSSIISDQLSKPEKLTRRDAKAVYSDVLYPDLCRLNAYAKNLKRAKLLSTVQDMVVTSGLLSIGLFAGLLPDDAKVLCTAVGGFQLSRELLNALASTVTDPESVRSHNLYFLWRLQGRKTSR